MRGLFYRPGRHLFKLFCLMRTSPPLLPPLPPLTFCLPSPPPHTRHTQYRPLLYLDTNRECSAGPLLASRWPHGYLFQWKYAAVFCPKISCTGRRFTAALNLCDSGSFLQAKTHSFKKGGGGRGGEGGETHLGFVMGFCHRRKRTQNAVVDYYYY